MQKSSLDPVRKEKLTSRALKANAGKVYSREAADAKIKERMDI
ncbi:MAG: hypothetical protein AAF600_21640 [Bacteroidota bacterium]